MGISTSVAYGMLFAATIVVGANLFSAFNGYMLTVQKAEAGQFDRMVDYVYTNIEISNVSRTGTTFTIKVKNTGRTTLNPDYVYLVDDDAWVPEGEVTHNMAGEYWEPEELLEINYTASIANHTFKVITEKGVADEFPYIA